MLALSCTSFPNSVLPSVAMCWRRPSLCLELPYAQTDAIKFQSCSPWGKVSRSWSSQSCYSPSFPEMQRAASGRQLWQGWDSNCSEWTWLTLDLPLGLGGKWQCPLSPFCSHLKLQGIHFKLITNTLSLYTATFKGHNLFPQRPHGAHRLDSTGLDGYNSSMDILCYIVITIVGLNKENQNSQ